MSTKSKGIPVAPLTGVLDVRSAPNDMPAQSLRMRQNMRTISQNKLRRGNGWQKFLSSSAYNNEDFHDQLLTFTPGIGRQPPTLMVEAESTRGVRSLFVATQSKIAQLNEYSGNYRIIGKGYGGTPSTNASAPRFKSAQVGDYLVFTNDFDRPMYHQLEANAVDSPALLKTFDDLELIGLTRAKVVWQWHNCLFFADVEMEGERFSYRLIWSDFNNPISFDPAVISSITGTKDLFSNERILAGMPLGNSFLIYTTRGIWEMVLVGGDQSFAFRRVFNGEENENTAILKYPNTLISLGDQHVYAAQDGLYSFNQYSARPQRPEWLHRSTPLIYQNINEDLCESHVAAFFDNELYISTASNAASNGCPDRTLRVNWSYQVSDFIDFGFTTFCAYRSFKVPTIRDFIIENAICTVSGLISAGYPWGDEGLPNPVPISTAPFTPKSFYTVTPQTISGVTTEDWNKVSADSDSLCALLGSERLDDICRKCNASAVFAAVSSGDWCLKQIMPEIFYRERCVNPAAVGITSGTGYASSVGSYLLDGYDSILRFAPMFAGKPDIRCEEFRLDYLAQPQAIPSLIGLRVGISAQPVDPNSEGDCGLVWNQHSLKPMKCLTNFVPLDHLKNNTVPSEYHHWNFFRKGRVLYLELKFGGTGGDSVLTGVTADAGQDDAVNY